MGALIFANWVTDSQKICSLLKKYRIVSIGVKSDWKDGLRTAVYETRMYGGVRGALRQLMAEPSTRLPAGHCLNLYYKGGSFCSLVSFSMNMLFLFFALSSNVEYLITSVYKEPSFPSFLNIPAIVFAGLNT